MSRILRMHRFAPALTLVAAPLAAQAPAVEFALPNGLRVEFRPAATAQTLKAVLMIPSGARTGGMDGMGALAPYALRLGGGGLYGYRDVDEQLEGMGASIEAEAGPDFTALRMRVFPRDLRGCLAILGAMLETPLYPDLRDAFTRSRRDTAVDSQTMAFSGLMASEGSVAWRKAGMEELRAWHRSHWLPSKARLLVSGPGSEAELRAHLTTALGGWKAGEVTAVPDKEAGPVKGGTYLRRDPGVAPAVLLAGVPVTSEAEENALDLALDSLAAMAAPKRGPGWRALRATATPAKIPAEMKRLKDELVRLGQLGLDAPRFAILLARHKEKRRVEDLDPEGALLRAARTALNGPVAEPTREGTNAILKRLLKSEEIRVLVVGEPTAPLVGAVVLKD